MSYSIVPIQSRLVKDVWQEARPLIDKALARDDRYQSEDILVALLRQEMQLWLIQFNRQTVATVITEIIIYPRAKECTVFLLSGKDAQEWTPYALAVIGQWAYENGCKRGRMFGRLGWDKVLPKEWKRQQVVMTVDLQEVCHERWRKQQRYANTKG